MSWKWLLSIISDIVGYFTRADERDVAEQTGERVGASETQCDDAVASNQALQHANQEATDANATRQEVDRMSDSQLDDALDRVRGSSAGKP